MASADGKLALPPLGHSQLPRLLPLATDFILADFDEKRDWFHFRLRREGLFVQPIQTLEIDAESYRNHQIKRGPKHCPCLPGIEIVAQFPERKKEKKHCGRGYQNLVRREQPHDVSQSQTNLSVQGT